MMMLQEDIEVARMMARAWKLNNDRNKRLAREDLEAKRRYAPIDDPNQE